MEKKKKKNKVLFGVQKKRPTKPNKNKLLNKVLGYLMSDSYLFAPLISSSPNSAFPTPNSALSSATAVKLKQTAKEKCNERFLKKVEEYLKSDSYMYASLVFPPQPHSIRDHSNGSLQYCKSTAMEVSMRTSILRDNQLTNEIAPSQASKDLTPSKIISDKHSLVRKETVKHMVYQNCGSSSRGKRMLSSQLRKFC